MKADSLRGAYVTIITPFDDDGNIDDEILRKLVEFQIESGIKGICPTGVTGETACLTDEEKIRVTEIVIDAVDGRVQVMPDIGTECYKRTLGLAKQCEQLGADAIIMFNPYLDIPTEEGLYRYCFNIAEELNIPLIMHNVPGRTNVDMDPELIAKLADHDNIIGVKDGNTELEHVIQTLFLTKDKDFSVLTGKDTLGYPLIKLGGAGHISVAANLIPKQIVEIVNFSLDGDYESALKIYQKYYELFKNLYIKTNPIPIKAAINKILFPVGDPQIPLTPLSGEDYEKFIKILNKVGLYKD